MLVPLLRPFMLSAGEGAATSIHLASAPELDEVSGLYFVKSTPRSSSKASMDRSAAARLWDVSAELLTEEVV